MIKKVIFYLLLIIILVGMLYVGFQRTIIINILIGTFGLFLIGIRVIINRNERENPQAIEKYRTTSPKNIVLIPMIFGVGLFIFLSLLVGFLIIFAPTIVKLDMAGMLCSAIIVAGYTISFEKLYEGLREYRYQKSVDIQWG